MKVKFEYERVHKDVSMRDFYNELKAFCDFMLVPHYHGPVLDNAEKLYKEKAFVCLLNKWAMYNSVCESADEESLFESTIESRDTIAWLISEML